jgi:hypothetical protein
MTQEQLRMQMLAGIITENQYKEENDTNSLIMGLRNELDEIREKYQGKLTRNTIRDEFREQMDKI